MPQRIKGSLPTIEPLGNRHDRSAFSCGVAELDDYLKRRARQDRDRRVAAVFVMVGDDPTTIRGYYTLSSFSIDLSGLPSEAARRLPRYPDVPAILIGRLAIANQHQGAGLGELLLFDALKRICEHAGEIAAFAVVVNAIDDRAMAFYERYGFIRFAAKSNRLFLPLATIEKMFA